MDFSSAATSGGGSATGAGGGGGSGGGGGGNGSGGGGGASGNAKNYSHHQHLHSGNGANHLHHHAHHAAHHLHHSVSGGHVSPPSQLGQLAAVGPTASLIKAEEANGNMATASPALAGFGVSAAGVNLSVNIGVNITGVTPETAAAPWATAAAYTSR